MYVLKQVFNAVSFETEQQTATKEANKQTEKNRPICEPLTRYSRQRSTMRTAKNTSVTLSANGWQYIRIVWHINTHHLNKIPSYDCFVWVSRTRPLFCCCWLVWMCLYSELVAICFIEILFITPICLQYKRHGVHCTQHTLTHIHGTFIVVQSNWNKPKTNKTEITIRRGGFFV